MITLFPKNKKIETIIKVGNNIKLSKEEIEDSKKNKMYDNYADPEKNSKYVKGTYMRTMTNKKLFENSKLTKTTYGINESVINPKYCKGKITSGKILGAGTEHNRKYSEYKEYKGSWIRSDMLSDCSGIRIK